MKTLHTLAFGIAMGLLGTTTAHAATNSPPRGTACEEAYDELQRDSTGGLLVAFPMQKDPHNPTQWAIDDQTLRGVDLKNQPEINQGVTGMWTILSFTYSEEAEKAHTANKPGAAFKQLVFTRILANRDGCLREPIEPYDFSKLSPTTLSQFVLVTEALTQQGNDKVDTLPEVEVTRVGYLFRTSLEMQIETYLKKHWTQDN